MNTFRFRGIAWLAYGWLCATPVIPSAIAAGYFTEDFEAFAPNASVTGNGWGTSSNSVVVESVLSTNLVDITQACSLPPGQILSNQVTMTANRIWSEAWLNVTNFMPPDTLPYADTSAVFMVSFSTNGYLYLCNPTSLVWEVCLTDATNGPANPVSTGSWVRVSVFQDYQSHNLAIFLNDQLIRKELSFINTNASSYASLEFDGAAGGYGHIDNVFVSNSTPAGLVSDSDHDGRPDAEEFTLFGALTNWSGSLITATVTNNIGGTVTPTNTGATVRWQGQTNFVLAATSAYIVDTVWTNGVPAADYRNLAVKSASFVWSNVVADGTVAAGFFYNGIRYVPGDYGTLTAAVGAALAGDSIIVSNGNYNEAVTISSNLTLVGTNLTGLTGMTLQTGVTVVVSGFTNLVVTGVVQVGTNGELVISNSVVNVGTLDLQNGAILQGYNSTATVNGVLYSGNFTLSNNWAVVIRSQALNVFDGFETYATNTRLDRLGYYGWNASSSNAVVVVNPDATGSNSSAQAAQVPAGVMISNSVNDSAASLFKIWTDVAIRESSQMDLPEQIDTNGAVVMCYINTNGYLVVLRPGQWDVCSNDVWGGQAPTIANDEWAGVSWFMDYGSQTVSYFIKGHLVRQQIPFARPAAHYNSFRMDVNVATGWLDNVSILTNVPPGLTLDLNTNNIADAIEIHAYGLTIDFLPRGSVYKIR